MGAEKRRAKEPPRPAPDAPDNNPALLAFADDLADFLVEVYLASLSDSQAPPDLGQDTDHG